MIDPPPPRPPAAEPDLLSLEPVPTLLRRARAELAVEFDFSRAIRISRAPGRLDVMGGVADCTGSMVCHLPLDRAAAVIVQERRDREVQVFSFNQFDAHQPFTLRIPLERLVRSVAEALRQGLTEPGRRWAAPIVGCLYVMHEQGGVDLTSSSSKGLNVALLSNVPEDAGAGASAAIEAATLMDLIDHFDLRDKFDAAGLAALCQAAENRVLDDATTAADSIACISGSAGLLARMICQPHELQPPLALPSGFRIVGIVSRARDTRGIHRYMRARCAASMGHAIILAKMREMGRAAGRELIADPMGGYLANLKPDDYKTFFRPYVLEKLTGGEFITRFGRAIDPAVQIDPDIEYFVQQATDHHVLEARRVRQFCELVAQAAAMPLEDRQRFIQMDKAGHLMYASHLSYTNDAMLGSDECGLLVDGVRRREKLGLYGARMTDRGCGGTVAVLCETGEKPQRALEELRVEYERATGLDAFLLEGSSPGAWELGTALV